VNLKKLVKFFLNGNAAQRRYFLESLGVIPKRERMRWTNERPLLVHACSIGEVQATQPLLTALRQAARRRIVVTTRNFTAYEKAVACGTSDAVYYLPYDDPWIIRRTLRWLRPSGVILLEADWWPNWLRGWHEASIPITVASGRFVPARQVYNLSFPYTAEVLRLIGAFGMQTAGCAGAVRDMVPDHTRVSVTGNLKFAVELDRAPHNYRALMTSRLNLGEDARVFVAGSVFVEEADSLCEAVASLLKADLGGHHLTVVVAPRYPEWADAFQAHLALRDLQSVRWTTLAQRSRRDDERVVIVDTVGELNAIYGVADVAFVGNSLYPGGGGQNLLEPVRQGVPTLTGPYTANFQTIVDEFLQRGGVLCVESPEGLRDTVLDLLRNPVRGESMVQSGQAILKDHRDVVDRTMAFLLPLLEQRGP
jgi:3-deoxy-D-manno-octulosonic-acid transferase